MSTGGELLGVAVLELTADPRPLDRTLAQSELRTEQAMTRMQRSADQRMQSLGRSMSNVGGAMTRNITGPMLLLGGAAVEAGAKFQQSMEMVHTQAGASQREVDKLTGKVLDLAKAMPQGPQQLAQGLFHLESIGLRGAKAMDALKVAAQGAAVGNASLEDTATALGSAWLVNIKGAGDLHNVMGILNATVGAGNMRMEELVQALGTGVLPAAKQAGLSIKDVMGALAVFTDEGYQASSAAAQFSTALHFLTNPTSKAAGALKDMGMSASEMAVDMHKPQGLLVALTDLKTHLEKLPGGVSGVKATQILGDILPGGRGRILLTLINQLDRYGMKLGQIGRTSKQFSEDFAKTQQTEAYKIHVAWSQLQVDAIQIGKKILPEVLSVGQTVVKDVGKVVTAFTSLPKGAQDMIIKGGLLLAGIGPAMKLLGLFTSGVGKLWEASKVIAAFAGFGDLAKGLGGGKLSQSVATMEVGTLIAKTMVGGPGAPGGVTPLEGAGAGATGEAAAAARWAKITAGIGGASVLGVSGFAAMSHAQNGALNKLDAFAHGIDPTSVLHLIGLPSVSDLLPGVKRKYDPAMVARAFGIDHATGQVIPVGTVGGRQSAGTPGMPGLLDPKSIAQANRDFTKTNLELTKLEQHRQGVGATAKALSDLARQAGKAGDVRWRLADTLGAELLKSRGVETKGVHDLIAQLDKLPPAARADAAQSMTLMATALETQKRLPLGASVRFVGELLSNYKDVRDKGGQYFKGLMSTVGDVMTRLKSQIATSSGRQRAVYVGEMQTLKTDVVGLFSQMESQVAAKQDQLSRKIKSGSSDAASKAAHNMYGFARAVDGAMSSGVLSAQDGSSKIAKAMNDTIRAFGGKVIPGVVAVEKASIGGSVSNLLGQIGGFNFQGAARGTLMQIGQPGQAGHDTVPMHVAGHNIVVGAGEQVAVFNRHQIPVVNAALAPIGGLPGLFRNVSTPNYLSRGGMLGGGSPAGNAYTFPFPKGEPFTWERIDQGQDLEGPPGGPVLAIAPGVVSVAHDRFGGFGPFYPTEQITSGPLAGRGVYYGHTKIAKSGPVRAGDVIAYTQPRADDWTAAPAGWLELGFLPYGSMSAGAAIAPILHALAAGHRVAGVGGATGPSGGAIALRIPSIGSPKVVGQGTVADIVRRGLGLEAKAANAYLAKHLMMSGGGSNSANEALAHRMMLAAGWGEGQWPALQALWTQESGFSSTATNSSSGAYGIPQSLPASKMASAGPDWRTNPATQIRWGLGYIRGRYGSPSGAEAHERAFNWYSQGGIVTGPASTFGPPGEGTGPTAYGGSDDRPGLALNPDGGGNFNDANALRLHGKWFDTSLDGHRGTFQVIDKGPSAIGRRGPRKIDFTGRAAEQMGFNIGPGGSGFPTDDIATATMVGGPGQRAGAKAPTAPSAGQRDRLKRVPKHQRHHRPVRTPLPHLIPLPALPQALIDALDQADQLDSGFTSWQGYLDTYWSSLGDLQPLVTQADGTQVLNPGDPTRPEPTGLIDPSTGKRTRSIADRLREIGDPNSQDTNTAFGIENKHLAALLFKQGIAGQMMSALPAFYGANWKAETRDQRETGWLDRALDLSQPLPGIESLFSELGLNAGAGKGIGTTVGPHGWLVPDLFSEKILAKVKEYRNAHAVIQRWRELKAKLSGERQLRSAKITARFAKLRAKLTASGLKATFNSSDQLALQIAELEKEKNAALGPASAPPPKGWKGDRTAWDHEYSLEQKTVKNEFKAREDALRAQARKAGLGRRLDQSGARASLWGQEHAERVALSTFFRDEAAVYSKDITDYTAAAGLDRTWIEDLRKAVKGQGGLAKTNMTVALSNIHDAQDLLNPFSQLSIDILTARQIDIPALLQEISDLKGTTVPADQTGSGSSGSGSTDNSAALAELYKTLAIQNAQALAVSQAQYGQLKLAPFGGVFHGGGVVPGPLGAERMALVQAGERITPAGASSSHSFHLIVEDGAVDPAKIRVIARDEATRQSREVSRHVQRRLPGSGSGQLGPFARS